MTRRHLATLAVAGASIVSVLAQVVPWWSSLTLHVVTTSAWAWAMSSRRGGGADRTVGAELVAALRRTDGVLVWMVERSQDGHSWDIRWTVGRALQDWRPGQTLYRPSVDDEGPCSRALQSWPDPSGVRDAHIGRAATEARQVAWASDTWGTVGAAQPGSRVLLISSDSEAVLKSSHAKHRSAALESLRDLLSLEPTDASA